MMPSFLAQLVLALARNTPAFQPDESTGADHSGSVVAALRRSTATFGGNAAGEHYDRKFDSIWRNSLRELSTPGETDASGMDNSASAGLGPDDSERILDEKAIRVTRRTVSTAQANYQVAKIDSLTHRLKKSRTTFSPVIALSASATLLVIGGGIAWALLVKGDLGSHLANNIVMTLSFLGAIVAALLILLFESRPEFYVSIVYEGQMIDVLATHDFNEQLRVYNAIDHAMRLIDEDSNALV